MDIGKIYPSQRIDFHDSLGISKEIPLGNVSFCPIREGLYLASIRQFNYVLDTVSHKGRPLGGFWDNRPYHMAVVDRNFAFVKTVRCHDFDMYEDLRLMRYGDTIQASGTDISYGKKNYRIVCLDLRLDEACEKVEIIRKVTFPTPHEKNYMPVEDGHGVFVTDLAGGKLKMTTVENPQYKTDQSCRGLIRYSGSSPLLRWRDGYVAMVHRHERRDYVNAFAFFDKRLLQCRISNEFTVFQQISPINFTCGMMIEEDKAILPVCVNDCETYLFRLPLEDFAKTARWRS